MKLNIFIPMSRQKPTIEFAPALCASRSGAPLPYIRLIDGQYTYLYAADDDYTGEVLVPDEFTKERIDKALREALNANEFGHGSVHRGSFDEFVYTEFKG